MNYGRLNIDNEQDKLSSRSDSISKMFGVYIVRALFLLFIAVVISAIMLIFGVYKGIIADTPDVSSINISPAGYATYIYDADGNQLQKLTSSNSNRTAVSIDRVPVDLQHAVVAIEDERFYEHNGIDPKGIIRAAFVGLKNKFKFTEGASTITQQLLKNNVFTEWTEEKSKLQSIKRKLQEQVLAVQLEKNLNNKQLILENYLNTINLGAGTYGVQAASKKYFNKDVWDLTLSEATVIAGITQNPSKYNPIRHPDENAKRRDTVLKKMVEQGYISQAQADEAKADNVYDHIAQAQEVEKEAATVYSYFVDELTEQVIDDLMVQKGYSETQAYQMLYSGGLRIYTTQDEEIQRICDEEFLNEENYPNSTNYELDWAYSLLKADGTTVNYSREMMRKYFRQNGYPEFSLSFEAPGDADGFIQQYKNAVTEEGDQILGERVSYTPEPQASAVVIDQYSGYVKAIVGGRGQKAASLTLNRATNTTRQPGSTFKVLGPYSEALDTNQATLATTYVDEPYNYADGKKVSNWLENTYQGAVTIREAIINSINVVAVKCITDVKTTNAYDRLLKYGFTTLSNTNDVYQALALGGLYNGVSNLELTAAYSAIANNGTYTKPIFYTKILDQYGNVVLDNTPETTQAIKPTTAFLLTSALESVVEKGTGMACSIPNMEVAGKTGTTSDYRDIWFVGYTPYYTCGVWGGYDDNSPLPNEGTYHDYSKILWKAIMTRIHDNLPSKDFVAPPGIVSATVCETTGLLATSTCPKAITEYFSTETAPSKTCDKHSGGENEYTLEDFMYYHGYGSGGNGTVPGAYALGTNDLHRFSYDEGESNYNANIQRIEDERAAAEAARKAAEEAARKAAEEAARKAAEEAAAAEAAAAAAAANQQTPAPTPDTPSTPAPDTPPANPGGETPQP